MYRKKKILTILCVLSIVRLLIYLSDYIIGLLANENHDNQQQTLKYQPVSSAQNISRDRKVTQVRPISQHLYPTKVPGLDLHVYSAVVTPGGSQGPDIRIIAYSAEDAASSFQCCFGLSSKKTVTVAAEWKFHFWNLKYKSTVYNCLFPRINVSIPETVSIGKDCLAGPRVVLGLTPADEPKGNLSICVHAVYGYVNPELIAEWVEMQWLQGVRKIYVYPLNHSKLIDIRTLRILEYYRDQGFVTLIPYSLTDYNQNPDRFIKQDGEMFSEEILPIYDCLARSSRYTFTAVIDFDEIILPKQDPLAVVPMLNNLYKKNPRAGYFSFRIENFIFNWTQPYNSDLIFVNYLYRTRPVNDRVKLIHVQSRYWSVAMHTSEPIKGYTGVRVPANISSIHHYTYCNRRWTDEMCNKLFHRYRDDSMVKIQHLLHHKVQTVPESLRYP